MKLGLIELLERSAEVMEREAEELKRAHVFRGQWIIDNACDRAAKEAHDEFQALADQLREAAADEKGRQKL
jgi:hypothetical protein